MIITLIGGPSDGMEMDVSDSVWRSGKVVAPIPSGVWFGETPIFIVSKVALYECYRVFKEWAGPCAMPAFIWKYQGTY